MRKYPRNPKGSISRSQMKDSFQKPKGLQLSQRRSLSKFPSVDAGTHSQNTILQLKPKQQLSSSNTFFEPPKPKKEEKLEFKPSDNVKEDRWTNFVRAVQTYEVPEAFLSFLKEKMFCLGQFSTQITAMIRLKVTTNTRKILKNYRIQILLPLISPILNAAQIQISDLTQEQLETLYKSIGQKNQEGIIQVLENYIDNDNQWFATSIKSLLQLYKEQIQDPVKEFGQPQEKNRNGEAQTQNFTKFIESKEIKVDPSVVEQIMKIKFDQGAFSLQIDNYINELKEIKKPTRTKLQRAFDEMFRNFELEEQIMKQLTQLEIDENEIKGLKDLIKRNEENKIKDKLQDFFEKDEIDQNRMLKLVKQLLDSRPTELILSNLSLNSSFSSQQSLNTSIKNSFVNQIKEQAQQPMPNPIDQMESHKFIKNQKENIQQQKKPIEKANQDQQKNKRSQNGKKQEYRQKAPQDAKGYKGQNPQSMTQLNYKKSKNSFEPNSYVNSYIPSKDSTLKLQRVNGKHSDYNQHDFDNKRISQDNDKEKTKRNPHKASRNSQRDFSTVQQTFGQNKTEFSQFTKQNEERNQNMHEKTQVWENMEDEHSSSKMNREKSTWSSPIYEVDRMRYQQPMRQTRYILVITDKNTNLELKTSNDIVIDLKKIQVSRKQTKELIATVYRLDLDPQINRFSLYQSDWFKDVFKINNQRQIWSEYLFQNFLQIEQFVNMQNFVQRRKYLVMFYLLTVLNEYSNVGQPINFWNSLCNFNLFLRPTQIYGVWMMIDPYNSKRVRFSPECSRLLLHFVDFNFAQNISALGMQSPLIQKIAFMTNFEEFHNKLQVFHNSYTHQHETKLIMYCQIHKLGQNFSVNYSLLHKCLKQTFAFTSSFDDKIRMAKSLRKICLGRLYQLYFIIKDSVDLQRYSLFEFLAFRFTLINLKEQYHEHRSPKLDQFRRFQMIQTMKEARKFINFLPKLQIEKLNEQLKRLKQYQEDIREILMGKYYNYNYFIFNHELFYDFYSELSQMKKTKNVNILQFFNNQNLQSRIFKGFEYVIQKTRKSPNMVALMCSLGYIIKDNLLKIIDRIQNRNHILQIVTCWFRDEFKRQKNDFFTKEFIRIMEYSKIEKFSAFQFMKAIEKFSQNQQMKDEVEKFAEIVMGKIKRVISLSELRLHLLQIKDIKKPVRRIYLQELAIRLEKQRPSLKTLQHAASEVIYDNNILREDKDLVLKKLFQNRSEKDFDTLRQQIIDYYGQGKKEILALAYYSHFDITLQVLIKFIEDGDMCFGVIENMNRQKNKLNPESHKDDFIKLGQLLNKYIKQIDTLKRQSNCLMNLLKEYNGIFDLQIEELKEWNRKIPQNEVKNSIKNLRKFNDYLNCSEQISGLMKISLWKRTEIKTMPDLLPMRTNTINQFRQLINSFENQTLGYREFRKYFKIDILSTLLQNVKDRNQTFKMKLSQYIIYLDETTLHKIAIVILAINQIHRSIQNSDHFEPANLEIVESLQRSQEDTTIEKSFNLIKSVDFKLKQLGFNVLDEDEEILKTLIFRQKYKRVFEIIIEKKIDSSTILNDLKDYINELQNSILKIEDIKELQNVVLFSEHQRKAKCFKKFLEDLRKQVQAKKLKISENIFNVDSKFQQLDQMIDSSANRQTSFKYDLQQIFKNSIVRIKDENGFAHVEIETKKKKQMSEGIDVKKQEEKSKFNFKKLTEFKQKAILLVSDFEKSNENQDIMKQTIDLFKEYLSLYKILEGIETALEKAIIYGYNPKDLNQEKVIIDSNCTQILKIKEEIQHLAKEWIQGMKNIYDQSYLLTHFMGPRLNAFINDTLNFKFSPLIKKIIDLDEKQFENSKKSLMYIGFDAKNYSPIEKVRRICLMFHKYEVNTLNKYERTDLIQGSQEKIINNRIELITCVNVQNYYYALIKGNAKPEMNQMLYCQMETSFEEIEVFIKRAIIKNHRKHYFIGVHYLPAEVQLKFIDLLNEYLTQKKRKIFNRCKLSFIDDSPVEKVYLHLCKKQLFKAKRITDTHLKNLQETKSLFEKIGQTYLVESRVGGLGKTYWAEKKEKNSNVVHFSIAGHVNFSSLLERLKAKKFVEDRRNTLIIQIGHVENKNKLEIFLFQLIFFKGFNFKQFFFLPKDTTIIVEIQNVYQSQDKYEYYSILKIIKEHKEKYHWIDSFRLDFLKPNFSDIKEAFTFYYLISIKQKTILRNEKRFDVFQTNWRNQNATLCSDVEARKLVKQYFCDPLQQGKTLPTFSLYKSFIKLLFIAFKTFSHNIFLAPCVWEQNNRLNRQLGLESLRIDFLNCSIMNCIQFLQATINTNEFDQGQDNNSKMISEEEDFRKVLTKFPFLIMPAYDYQSYQFVYLHSKDVNISIKSLIISQTIDEEQEEQVILMFNQDGYEALTLQRRLTQKVVSDLFSKNALQNLKEDALEREIYSILFQLSGNPLFNIPSQTTIKEFKNQHDQIKNYSITLDNFFKMCLIIQRAVSHIPIIIMGESGVGKTALIRFLVQVVFRHEFLVFNVHAGVDEQKLMEYYRNILEASERIKPNPQHKVWVFFDEFNTTDELSYIKEMIVDRKFQGQPIPENVVLIGACNPYRKRKQSNFKRAGIKKKNNQQLTENSSDLAFKVKPPSLSMIQFMWDYQQLQRNQNLQYVSKILQSLQLTQHEKAVQAIANLHQYFKKIYEISSVSLRDVARFKQLYIWFLKNMPRKPDNKNVSKKNPNYEMNDEERAISLSIAFCYSLRIADRQQRKNLLIKMTKLLEFKIPIEQVVQNQQIDYVERLSISIERIAVNFSLRQNVFTALVCIMNKIPILIIGNPGNSKSLSIRMISSNLRGANSESQFCRNFSELSIIYFQGSEVCTSKGVETVFQKAITSNNAFKMKKQSTPGLGDVQNCILFDEIGLAEKSIHNPLKVLHSKLETTNKQICFIGISNWELDAAKMSRFLVLSRSNPQKQQLRDTAIKILGSYLKRETMNMNSEKTFREMSDWYYEFVKQWDQKNKGNQKEGFFGLRDFYCYIKFVAGELEKKGSNSNIDDIIRRAIYTNFDGQEESVELFLEISGLGQIQKEDTIEPISLVQQNLIKDSSRSLLLIVRGDALLNIIQNRIQINGQKRRIQCIYGSTFASDQQSEEYNLQITSIIISHMSRGTLLTFKNPNNSIQTSLYDVFNKSFTISGPKKYCRVAVGANSNPKCVVHESFGSVVFMDEQTIKNTDLAFLNRFQKHFLTLSNVITDFEKQIVNQIKEWIEDLTKFKSKTQYKKQEHYLVNSSQESVVTLVIKYRHQLNNQKENGIKKIKKALLNNATQHFFIALKSGEKNLIPAGLRSEIYMLLAKIQNESQINYEQRIEDQKSQDFLQEQSVPRDKIIFTYDMNIYSTSTYMFCTDRTLKIRISEIKSERQLRKALKDAFASDAIDNIHILIDFYKQFHHVNFVSFLLTGLKNSEKSNKTIFIIIKLSQTSLQNSGRDHINISYLLDFEQMFIGSLTLGQSFMEAIQNKNVKKLYVERKMSENFDNFYVQALRRFRIIKNQQELLKGVPAKDVEEFQFDSMMKMNENQVFKKEALNFIQENLSEDKIDMSIILNSKEDRNLCGSPQQTFEKYLQNCVIQVICIFFERIYRNSLLFAFDVPKLFSFLKKYYDLQILEIIYVQNKQAYDKFLGKLLDAFVKDKSLFAKQYLKANNSNFLEITSFCLLPMGLVQLGYISSNSEDSLFKTSSKILQLSVDPKQEVARQCQFLMGKCLSILNQKSVFLKSSLVKEDAFDFEKLLNQNESLQLFYFFDMISKIYSESIESINTAIFPLEKLVYLFVQIFSKLKIKQKVILLSLSKELWSNLFNIWSLWITHKDSNFHFQIKSHYLQNPIINEQNNEPHQLPKLLKELCRSTLILQEKLLRLDGQNIEKNYGMQKYLSFFRKTYFYIQKIRLTCMDLNVETSQTMKATKRFFDLLDELYERDDIETQLTVFLTTQESSFAARVEIYLSRILKDEDRTDKEREDILSYLSLDIYGMWINRLNAQKGQGKKAERQIQKCVKSFIRYSDLYTSFANNSNFFLQTIFEKLVDDALTIEKKFQYIEHSRDEMIKTISQKLSLSSNFAVALGNLFMNSIRLCAQIEYEKEQQKMVMNQEANKESFVKKYFHYFQELIKRTHYPNKVLEVFSIEFLKYYCLKYLEVIDDEEEHSTTWKVDKLLNETSQIADTLRLYLLKNILYREQKMTLVKEKYLDSKICKWLEHFRTSVSGKTFQLLTPPPLQEESTKMSELIHLFRNQQYENIEIFTQMLQQSFASPNTKYQFLTFMMNDVYTRSCPEERVLRIAQIINTFYRYENFENNVELKLLNCYIKHKITSVLKYEVSEMEFSQTKIEEFVVTQLVFINYLNIFVSCKNSDCPLIEMFFEMNGNVPQNYVDWLENRFLVNGRENQFVSILKRFIQLGDDSPGYYKCSAQCDMFYTIGGSGGFGCPLPNVQGTCGLCNEIIGGTNHILTRANQGARRVDLALLPQQMEIIREKKTLQVLNHKLIGYSYSLNTQDMIKEVEANRRSPDSAKFILQQMMFTVWSFLTSTGLLPQQTIQQIFHMNLIEFEAQSNKIMRRFYDLETKTLNLNEQDQSNLVWHLGISKQIMKFIIEYKTKLSNEMDQKMGIVKCIGRDTFEQYLVDNVFLKHSSGNQKQALVNTSRRVNAGVNFEGQQLLKETGGYEKHLQKYPNIRLIKLLQEDKSPCFDNLVEQYRETIEKDFKILSYYIEHAEEIQKLAKYRILYTFITKILKIFNMKVTRRDAKEKTIIKLYEQVYRCNFQREEVNTESLNSFREEVIEFCEVWNELREGKFDLRYGCHSFGLMNQVTEKLHIGSPAINFFPDKKYKGDQKGQMILSLLQVTAQQYNDICRQINHRKMGSKKYRQIEIFNPKQINPTQIQQLTKTLLLNKQLVKDVLIANFSSWSVEYGCGLPHYSIAKIESLIVEHIVGCHNLNEQIKDYDEISFIGEQLNLIIGFRRLNNQHDWKDIPKKQQIEKYINNLKQNEPDSFLKEITSIKGSLELILDYFRLRKDINIQKMTIENFITVNKIKIQTNSLLPQELLYSVGMGYVLALYEFIQFYTLKNSVECLNDSYKKQKLSVMEEGNLKLLFGQLKKQYKPEQDINFHISVALYRFAVRSLLLVELNQSLILFDFLFQGEDLWPNLFNIERLTKVNYFREAFSITLTKMQSLLGAIPLEIRKTKIQALYNDQKQFNKEIAAKRQKPETLTRSFNKKYM